MQVVNGRRPGNDNKNSNKARVHMLDEESDSDTYETTTENSHFLG